jgi:hypothetical protein
MEMEMEGMAEMDGMEMDMAMAMEGMAWMEMETTMETQAMTQGMIGKMMITIGKIGMMMVMIMMEGMDMEMGKRTKLLY